MILTRVCSTTFQGASFPQSSFLLGKILEDGDERQMQFRQKQEAAPPNCWFDNAP